VCQLYTDLVVSSGVQGDVQKRNSVLLLPDFIIQNRFLGILAAAISA
jgi:hypothetical protein